jgi:hypothetical protein
MRDFIGHQRNMGMRFLEKNAYISIKNGDGVA